MSDEIRDQRVPILLTKSELERLDDWMFARRMRSRGEAIRILMEVGFKHARDQADGGAAEKESTDG